MYLVENMVDKGDVKADVKPASVYRDGPEGWKEYPDPDSYWLGLDCGPEMIRLRMTVPQLAALYRGIQHGLQDIHQCATLADVVDATVSGEGPDVGAPPAGTARGD